MIKVQTENFYSPHRKSCSVSFKFFKSEKGKKNGHCFKRKYFYFQNYEFSREGYVFIYSRFFIL